MENIKINLKATNIDLTESIRDHVEKRVTKLGKLLSSSKTEVFIEFEVAKTTNHHNNSENLFRAECKVNFFGKDYYAASEQPDLYLAIDSVKDIIFRDIKRDKNKTRNLFIRGARVLKRGIRGLGFGK